MNMLRYNFFQSQKHFERRGSEPPEIFLFRFYTRDNSLNSGKFLYSVAKFNSAWKVLNFNNP